MSSYKVKTWRKKTKERIVDMMGGKCIKCGYDKCITALELHHLNPKIKERSISGMITNSFSWEKILNEIKKCILVCTNCHREIHYFKYEINELTQIFDEIGYNPHPEIIYKSCQNCSNFIRYEQSFCCSKCTSQYYGKLRQKVDWSTINITEELKTLSQVQLAKKLGVSPMAIRKKLKRYAAEAGIEPAPLRASD